MTNKEKFLALVSNSDSKSLEELEFHIKNREWLRHSQQIAIKILIRLDELKITQHQLAERMNLDYDEVNKFVKGKENFTIETISKIEKALDMKLVKFDFKTKK